MITFKQFAKVSNLLNEGGNVSVNGVAATRVDLTKVSRPVVANAVKMALVSINKLYNQKFGEALWKNEDVLNGHAFNGSSEAFFDKSIPDDEFVSMKSALGDIDVTCPEESRANLGELLDELKGKQVTPNCKYIGSNKDGQSREKITQYNTIFQMTGLSKEVPTLNVQIDFELTEYENDAPTEFTKFAHSSHVDDLRAGKKGVFHKFLLGGLVGGTSNLTSDDIVLFTKAATAEKPKVGTMPANGISMNAFSVDKGLRKRLIPVNDKDGNQISKDGKPVWKEQEPSESKYTTKLIDIAKHIFGEKFNPNDLPQMWSSVGLLGLMKKYCTPLQIQQAFDKMASTLFGKGSQHINQTVEEDQAVKLPMWKAYVEAFPKVDQTKIKALFAEYYPGFEARQAAMDAKRATK